MSKEKLDLSIEQLGDYAYLNLDFDRLEFDLAKNPIFRLSENPIMDVLRMIRDPDYLPFTCKHIFGGLDLFPLQHVILTELYAHPFPLLLGSRGLGKTFLMAVYIMWRLLRDPGIQVVVVGAAFRQSKMVYQYCEKIWNSSPILRTLCGTDGTSGCFRGTDRYDIRIGTSNAIFVPLGAGDTIRGLRANITICDEFSMVPVDVYETVVKGFGAVSNSPAEQVRQHAKLEYYRKLQLISEEQEREIRSGFASNQSIISGTAYYSFNSFCQYFKRYHKIITSQGNQRELQGLIAEEDRATLDWRDFCIIRIPMELVPRGFLELKTINQTKAMVPTSVFDMEYHTIFPEDSTGFFRRSLIEHATIKGEFSLNNESINRFEATITKEAGWRYVIGVDPASERDNAAVVVLAIKGPFRKVVYCWTINDAEFREKIKDKEIQQQDYYGYIARKLRDLMKTYDIDIIAIDFMGGGKPIIEALCDADKMKAGELPVYPVNPDHVLYDGKERATDWLPGLHIIEVVNFCKADYVSEANHGMKKDMEDRVLVFPYFDAVSLAKLTRHDYYDSLEDNILQVEELKNELTSIAHSQTTVLQREKWDTPEIKMAENRKGRMRKDRYSALLMANMAARRIHRQIMDPEYKAVGGFAGQMGRGTANNQLYHGPSWFTGEEQGGRSTRSYGAGVRRQ